MTYKEIKDMQKQKNGFLWNGLQTTLLSVMGCFILL